MKNKIGKGTLPANGDGARNLAEVATGERVTVKDIHGMGPVPTRLMEMGIVPGIAVRVVKTAPFGDPIELKVRGYSLALRKSEAEIIEIITLQS